MKKTKENKKPAPQAKGGKTVARIAISPYFAVAIPEKTLCDMVACDLAGLFDTWARLCGEDLALYKAFTACGCGNNFGTLRDTSELVKYVDLAAKIFREIDTQWRNVFKGISKEDKPAKKPGQKPSVKPPTKPVTGKKSVKATPTPSKPNKPSKPSAAANKPTLSNEEKEKVRILRLERKWPVKKIAKEIHRSDKVVSPYVRYVDKTLKAVKKA